MKRRPVALLIMDGYGENKHEYGNAIRAAYDKMGYDVRLGDVFIFINRLRTTMKLLHAEDGGLVLYIKRLEEGTFRLPEYDQQSKSYPMEWREQVMMVEGINNGSAKRLKRLKTL